LVTILDDMGVSKLSANFFFFKVNFSFKCVLLPDVAFALNFSVVYALEMILRHLVVGRASYIS